MKVDRARAIRLQVADHTYYFCSEHCMRAYQVGGVDRHGGLADHAHVHRAARAHGDSYHTGS